MEDEELLEAHGLEMPYGIPPGMVAKINSPIGGLYFISQSGKLYLTKLHGYYRFIDSAILHHPRDAALSLVR